MPDGSKLQFILKEAPLIMKRRKKSGYLLMAMLTLLLLFIFALPAEAEPAANTIKVYTGINMYLDGAGFAPKDSNGDPIEAFIHSGVTYLPLRALSQALDLRVDWDGGRQSVYLWSEGKGGIAPFTAYAAAYREFLLDFEIDLNVDFPVYAYHLLDINFDGVPELGVWHHSGGSLGGYFTYYYFDGEKIAAVLDDQGLPAKSSDQARTLADPESKKVYFLQEMGSLQGNPNLTYGYVREMIDRGGALSVYDILSLRVDEESVSEKHLEKRYYYEDDFLSDAELDGCLITRYYSGGEWREISSGEYLKLKRELIPAGNNFADLRETGGYVYLYDSIVKMSADDDSVRITAEQIDTLLSMWRQYLE